MSFEEFLACFDARWTLLLINTLCVTGHLSAEVDGKVCQVFTFFSFWQDLYQEKKILDQKLSQCLIILQMLTHPSHTTVTCCGVASGFSVSDEE